MIRAVTEGILLGRHFFGEKNIRERMLGAACMVVGVAMILL